MDKAFIRELKAKAHHLNPVILIGAKGLTEAVIAETDEALKAHELIKIKMNGIEREDRALIAQEIVDTLNATLVQLIGNMAVIYRKNIEE